jgi:hypothetical protein
MERLGLNADPNRIAAEPPDIADEILAHIKKGPALHPGGNHETAMHLRALPRDKAVYAMAGFKGTAK